MAFSILTSIGEKLIEYALNTTGRRTRRKLCEALSDYYDSIGALYDASLVFRKLVSDKTVVSAAKDAGLYGDDLGRCLEAAEASSRRDSLDTWAGFRQAREEGKASGYFRLRGASTEQKIEMLTAVEAILMEEIGLLTSLSRGLRSKLRTVDPEFAEAIHGTVAFKFLWMERRWATGKISSASQAEEILRRFQETKEKVAAFMRDFCKDSV